MAQIKKIGVWQTARVAAILFIPLALIVLATGKAQGKLVIFFILAPLLYCALGFIFAALSCAIYNFVARKIGGIEIELDKE
jgi:hypothetical protein